MLHRVLQVLHHGLHADRLFDLLLRIEIVWVALELVDLPLLCARLGQELRESVRVVVGDGVCQLGIGLQNVE